MEWCELLANVIDCRYQSNMAQEVLNTIMSIQPKDSSGGSGETRESIVYKLANDMLSKLPRDYNPHEVSTCVCVWCVGVGVCVGGVGRVSTTTYPLYRLRQDSRRWVLCLQ